MAKIHLDHLKGRYGFKGERLQGLVQRILTNNIENVSRAQARKSQASWEKVLKKIPGKGKAIIAPKVEDAMPPRGVFVMKSAEKGKVITDTVRDKLTKDLRETLGANGGELWKLDSKGRRQRLHPKVVEDMKRRITGTFEGYVKAGKYSRVPPNIDAIATTEVRSATNAMKHVYADTLQKNNPEAEVFKKWIQNKSLAKRPRKGHAMVHGSVVGLHEYFLVPNYVTRGGSEVLAGMTPMGRPHDEGAPASQVIACSCECQYFVQRSRS